MSTTARSPPYARMVGNRFDVSAYCSKPLVDALDHLTSVKFALLSLIRPALKIAARSLFVEHETITWSNILSQLNNADVPLASAPPEAPAQRPKRSFRERVIHFITVGIPLAIIVGLVAGVLHSGKAILSDVSTVFSVASELYSMSERDRKFYKENPDLLPPRNEFLQAVVNGGLMFYASRLVYRKLGMFSFLAKPLLWLVENLLTKRVIAFFEQIDRLRGRTTTTDPSAPPAPFSSAHNQHKGNY